MNIIGLIDLPLTNSGNQGKSVDSAEIIEKGGNLALLAHVKFGKDSSGGDSKKKAGSNAPGSSLKKYSSSAASADGLLSDTGAALLQAGEDGLDIEGMNLKQNANGKLSDASKSKVNKLTGRLSSELGAEVGATVYNKGDGQLGLRLFTSNMPYEVSFEPPDGTIYSGHTQPDDDANPSKADFANGIEGAEDVIIPADDVPGNETGEYIAYE